VDVRLSAAGATTAARGRSIFGHQEFIRFLNAVERGASPAGFLKQCNAEPRPFVWTAAATSILAKLSKLPVAAE